MVLRENKVLPQGDKGWVRLEDGDRLLLGSVWSAVGAAAAVGGGTPLPHELRISAIATMAKAQKAFGSAALQVDLFT